MSHPYYPQNLVLEGYAPNTRTYAELIGSWLFLLLFLTITTFVWTGHGIDTLPRKLTLVERLTALWFVSCGVIHVFFEGHFVQNHSTLASLTDLISQEWKEYAKSDSRYLNSDSFILAIETITATIWGPLCFYIAIAIKYQFPSRHIWSALMCFAHIYGNALYYTTTILQGCPDSRPEFMYFWVYFVGLNGLWLITPIMLLVQSIYKITGAMREIEHEKNTKKYM